MADVRYVKINGKVYILVDDVYKLIEDYSATEETDSKRRLNGLIEAIKASVRYLRFQ